MVELTCSLLFPYSVVHPTRPAPSRSRFAKQTGHHAPSNVLWEMPIGPPWCQSVSTDPTCGLWINTPPSWSQFEHKHTHSAVLLLFCCCCLPALLACLLVAPSACLTLPEKTQLTFCPRQAHLVGPQVEESYLRGGVSFAQR